MRRASLVCAFGGAEKVLQKQTHFSYLHESFLTRKEVARKLQIFSNRSP